VKKEIENLKRLKTLDKALPSDFRRQRQSMTIDLRNEKGLRDSWRQTIEEVELSRSLKNDESYQQIMQSKSQEDLSFHPSHRKSQPKPALKPDSTVSQQCSHQMRLSQPSKENIKASEISLLQRRSSSSN